MRCKNRCDMAASVQVDAPPQADEDSPPQSRALRIAVLSVPFGGGHRAIADGVKHVLAQNGVGLEIQILDAMDLASDRLPLRPWTAWLYSTLTRRRLRPVYAALFGAVDRWPNAFGRAFSLLFSGRANSWLRSWKPDVVVSTFPLVSYVLGEALRRAPSTDVRTRLITFVTDAGRVNRSWFAGRVDGFAVTHPETKHFAEALGLDGRVVEIDLPLRADFYRPTDRVAARSRLGLGSRPAVLIWGGGQGLAHGVESLVDMLANEPSVVTPVVVTGNNGRLASRLRRRSSAGDLRVLGECDDVPSLLSAVDAVVGKAGWVSLSEARASGLSTLCIDALPGQERENLRVSRGQGFANWVPDPYEAAQLVRRTRERDFAVPAVHISATDRQRLCELILGYAHTGRQRSPRAD